MADEPTPNKDEADSELLTAYLDGELSDPECIAVEKRLAEEPAFHRLMCELQNAWDMLDSLPLVQPGSQFVRTTVEMAIAGHKPKSSTMGNIVKGLLLLLIPATAFGMSYFLKRESIEKPERELIVDLPLIEKHDFYELVVHKDSADDGISFLKSIYSRGLFQEVDDLFDSREEPPNDFEPASESPDPQQIKDRSDRLSRMTDQQRSDLFDKKAKFEALDPKQQQTLREFHDLLAKDSQRIKLAEVMSSYYDWLLILGQSQRAKLQDMPLDKRLTEIRRITGQQAQKYFGTIGSTKLPPDDSILFYQWYDVSIRYLAPEIRERIGVILTEQIKDREAQGLATNELVVDRIVSGPIEQLVEYLMRKDRQNIGQLLCENSTPQSIGLDYLRKVVSEEAASIIDEPGLTELNRQELILTWIETANRARFPIKKETLESFYYQELSQEERDQVDNLHPDNRDDTLKRLYWDEKIGERSAPSEDEAFQEFLRQSGWDSEFGMDDDA